LFQQILRLPTVIIDITTYSETGYVGQDPSTILTRLLHAADDNPLLASIGIVCLDEFDKIASGQNNAVFAGAGTTKDVTGMGVQRELLKMLESSEVVVPLELTHSTYGDHICCRPPTSPSSPRARSRASTRWRAAAPRATASASARGGGGRRVQRRHRGQLHLRRGRTARELPGLRLPAELLARFTRFVPFEALDAATLMDILRSSVLDRLTREFEEEGFELVVDEDVLHHVIAEGLRRETGARACRRS